MEILAKQSKQVIHLFTTLYKMALKEKITRSTTLKMFTKTEWLVPRGIWCLILSLIFAVWKVELIADIFMYLSIMYMFSAILELLVRQTFQDIEFHTHINFNTQEKKEEEYKGTNTLDTCQRSNWTIVLINDLLIKNTKFENIDIIEHWWKLIQWPWAEMIWCKFIQLNGLWKRMIDESPNTKWFTFRWQKEWNSKSETSSSTTNDDTIEQEKEE